MINPVTSTKPTEQNVQRQIHKKLVSSTGYAAVGLGTVCGVTGLKNIKFKNKMKIHKYTAFLAAAFTFLHLGIAKGLDKLFYKENK